MRRIALLRRDVDDQLPFQIALGEGEIAAAIVADGEAVGEAGEDGAVLGYGERRIDDAAVAD